MTQDYREIRSRSENHRCADCDIGDEMADEIERLRTALMQIAALDVHHKSDTGWTDVGEIARAALEPKP